MNLKDMEKHCRKCGTEYEGDITYCTNCGTKIKEETTLKYCGNCGAKVTKDLKRCKKCKKLLSSPKKKEVEKEVEDESEEEETETEEDESEAEEDTEEDEDEAEDADSEEEPDEKEEFPEALAKSYSDDSLDIREAPKSRSSLSTVMIVVLLLAIAGVVFFKLYQGDFSAVSGLLNFIPKR